MAVLHSCAGLDGAKCVRSSAVLTEVCALQSLYPTLYRRLAGSHAVTYIGTILHRGGDWLTSNTKLPALDFFVTGQDIPRTYGLHRRARLRRDKTPNVCFPLSLAQPPQSTLCLASRPGSSRLDYSPLSHGDRSTSTPRATSSFSICV